MARVFTLPASVLFALTLSCVAQNNPRPIRIAFLDFGNSPTGRRVADRMAEVLASNNRKTNNRDDSLQVIDRDWARAAALGAGYRGSLNLTLPEARDLGSAIGCDFFFAGKAGTERRSPADGSPYFESYAAIYLVSARTGKLALWERPAVQRPTPGEAEEILLQELVAEDALYRYRRQIRRALEDEQAERASAIENNVPVIEALSDDQSNAGNGVQAPRPYRRLKPPYPESAAHAEIEATVDVLVDIDVRGEVGRVEVARWAGYGLDQSVVDTVRQLHFFPAHRDGAAIPIRVLLRYNFRKPPK
ncbi:MAG TPA: TonB family protein [Pyrinomonadaceae bacterium]|nr:TonB family protein [Pyrinomonadaceae bacterium]